MRLEGRSLECIPPTRPTTPGQNLSGSGLLFLLLIPHFSGELHPLLRMDQGWHTLLMHDHLDAKENKLYTEHYKTHYTKQL